MTQTSLANRHFINWGHNDQLIKRKVVTVCARIYNFNFNGRCFTVAPVNTTSTSVLSRETDRSWFIRAVVPNFLCDVQMNSSIPSTTPNVMFQYVFYVFQDCSSSTVYEYLLINIYMIYGEHKI